MTRDELQGLAAHRLAKSKRLCCQWSTGCGKSNIVLKFLKSNPEMDCLILVPEQNNIQNWYDEFKKFNVPSDKVTIACYASFHKFSGTVWDLVVFDEVPHLDTEIRRYIARTVKGHHILALGAVVDEDEMKALEEGYGKFEQSYVSLKKAIQWGILPPPVVNVMHMDIIKLEGVHKYKGRTFTPAELYEHIQQKVQTAVDNYNRQPNKYNQQLMYLAGSERKRLLGQLKEDAMRKICNALNFNKKRFLCFCASIKQAESLGGNHAFTSKTPTSFKLLERFNNHEINSLFVVGKLIEGQNLKDIDCGIIGQLGGTSRITVQEIGRILRSTKPVIYIPVFDGTKDDSFLYTLTANVPKEYIKHYNY